MPGEQGGFYKPSRKAVVLLCGVFIALLVVSCRRSTSNTNATPTPQPAVEVTTAQATPEQVPVFIQATGSLVADESSDVSPQTSGQVVATPIDVGAFVRAGDTLARLDDRDARLRLQQAQGSEQQAAASVRQAEERLGLTQSRRFNATEVPEVRAARLNYEAAEQQARLAEDTARRYANLVRTGDTSQLLYNQRRTEADTARAQAEAARQQYETAINTARQSNQAIATARGALEAARAQTALAQKTVSDTVIRAPFAGYINDRPAAPGEYVTPSSKIATLMRTSPIKVELQLPEADAGRVRVGMSVSATVSAFRDQQFSGQVTAIKPSLDPAARSVTVEAQIENSNNQLRPGMFATARILQPGGKQTVFVPAAAVLSDPTTNTASVYVIDGDKAHVRAVQVGQQEGDRVELVNGVNEGETVATSNLQRLYDGVTVRRQ